MILPPPLERTDDGLRLGPARVEIIATVQGLALLLCGHRLAEDGTVEPIAGPDLPMPLGSLRGPAETLPETWARGFDPEIQRLLAQALEAAALLLPRGRTGRLEDAATIVPDAGEPFPLLPDHPDLLPRLLAPALARVGSLVCHAHRPIPLPPVPSSAHARLRRIDALLANVAHPSLASALRPRLAQA